MIILENGKEVSWPEQNTIIGDVQGDENTIIEFKGTGSILFCEDGVRLESSHIRFCTVNAVVYLSSGRWPYKINIDAWRDTTAYFGRDNYYNGTLTAILSEKKSVIIGGGGVFSFGIWIRTADPHLLYDASTKKRINPSKSVLIGDHVWLGQNATILKGTRIGSGSVLAAGAVISGKAAGSNTVWGGNPAREIRKNIIFTGASVHDYTEKRTKDSQLLEGEEYLFSGGGDLLSIDELDKLFFRKTPVERVVILKGLAAKPDRNRFYIAPGKTGLLRRR